ncbi:MAG: hypothetical protein H6696_19185 [Deferribacteres bacterium]|nr:hypothetical protein [candidate division KSB1 bacterium]MCB9504055.1 hypothetical protein [Deferribacteres bacterium]
MSKYKIYITDNIAEEAVSLLRDKGFDAVAGDTLAETELAKAIGEYDAIAIRSASKITATVLENPGKLKLVVRGGVGIDNIDVSAATAKNVAVANTPGANTIATAELTFGLMLALARHIATGYRSLSQGEWDRKSFRGVELYGKTLGLLGFGRIGREVAKRAQAFGMKVLAYDPYLPEDVFQKANVQHVSLDALWPAADFISLHLPATAETKGIINSETIAKMKDGVRIINAARGNLVEDVATAHALASGKIAGVALDVYPTEPPAAEFALLNKPGVLHVPHLGASSFEAQDKVATEVVEVIAEFLTQRTGSSVVNLKELS